MPADAVKIEPIVLKRMMEELGLTSGRLARILYVSESTVSRWLRGKVSPSGTSYAVLVTLLALSELPSLSNDTPGKFSPEAMEPIFSMYRLHRALDSLFCAERNAVIKPLLEDMVSNEEKLAEMEKQKEAQEERLKLMKPDMGLLGKQSIPALKKVDKFFTKAGTLEILKQLDEKYSDEDSKRAHLSPGTLEAIETVRMMQSQILRLYEGKDQDPEFRKHYLALSYRLMKTNLTRFESLEDWLSRMTDTLKEALRADR